MSKIIIDNFKETRKTTIQLAGNIASGLFDDRVTGEFHHISSGVAEWLAGTMHDGQGSYARPKGKRESLSLLRSSEKRLLRYWKNFGRASVSEEGFLDFVLYITSHEAHHRGRVVEYLHGKAVTVPFMPRCYPKL